MTQVPKLNSSPISSRNGAQTVRSDPRLRVLLMIGFLGSMGGAERFTQGLAKNLPQDQFETWLCAPRGGDETAIRELAEAGVRFVDLGRRRKRDYHRTARLASLLRRERFDLIHSHMFGSNVWATALGRAYHVPVLIAHEHTWSYEGNWLRARLDGYLIGRLTTRFVAVSSADARRMISIEGVPPGKVTVLPTAYIPSSLGSVGDVRAELGLTPHTPLVGTATVMRPQKALDVLLAAHVQVLQTVPDAHLVLAGDGEQRTGLERRARELGIGPRTHFLGYRRDVDSIIRSLDVAAMSSDFEGMPLFVFECMAGRTPLVATRVGGLSDIVDDGRTGILVSPQRPQALAAAISDLLVDPDRRLRIAGAAAAHLENYTIEKISGRFADLYMSLSAEQHES